MPGPARRRRKGSRRLQAGLRRHGLVRRPPAIVERVGRDLRFTEGNAVEVHERGREGLAATLEALGGARQRLHLETYILRTDTIGRRFLEAMTERAAAGVRVRLIYDAVGSRGIDPVPLADLRRAGGEVLAFNPLRHFQPHWLPRRRDHRKILTVDGEIGFTGGLNVGDEYWGRGEDGADAWRDTWLALRGPVVRDLDAVFLESWFRADGPDLPWHELLGEEPPPAGRLRCALLPDGPVYRRRRMRDLVVAGLESARERVAFASPYFAPGPAVIEALGAAGRRGVRVDLLVAGPHSDHPWLRRGARSLFPRLLEAGVRVYEYQGAMMHAKVGLFDGRWAVVGSSNLDRQSLRHSYELNVVLEGREPVERLEQAYARDLARSEPVDVPHLAARGGWERIGDALAGWLLRLV